jgi:hypothetical protein
MEMKTVDIVRKIRDSYYNNLKNKSRDEQKAFYREKAEIINKKAREIIQKNPTF